MQSFTRLAAAQGFVVRNVLVEGRKNTDPAVLLGLVGARRGEPIFAFNPEHAQTALEQDPWIESARIERRLPDVVFVTIRERAPFALWQDNKKIRLIDEKGAVITSDRATIARFRALPLVVGPGAPQAAAAFFALLHAEPVLMQRFAAAVYVGHRRWDLELKDGVTVRLPQKDVSLALRRLSVAQEKDALLDRPLASIDLRESGRLILKGRQDAGNQPGIGM